MEPIVPERRDRIGRSDAPRDAKTAQQKTPKPGGAGTPPTAKPSGLLLFVVILLLAGTVALGVFALSQQQNLQALQAQFDDLQAKIDTTDESLNQSGAALSIKLQDQAKSIEAHEQKLKEHFSEIDKLWAARNAQKQQIAEMGKATADFKKQLASSKSSLDKAVTQINSARTAALSASAATDELAARIDKVLSQVEQFEKSIKQWQVSTNARVAENEDAIKAIDVFRRNVNQQLLDLRGYSAPGQ